MHDCVAMFFDAGGLADKWQYLVLAGVVTFGFWLLQRAISSSDRRQEADRTEVRDQGKTLNDVDKRTAILEVQIELGSKLERLVVAIEKLAERREKGRPGGD